MGLAGEATCQIGQFTVAAMLVQSEFGLLTLTCSVPEAASAGSLLLAATFDGLDVRSLIPFSDKSLTWLPGRDGTSSRVNKAGCGIKLLCVKQRP